MYTVFVIGNIASGKSTATRYLESRGARRIDLDELAKSLYAPGSDLVSALAETFGGDILDTDGSIIPARLAQHAFSSHEQTERLNALVHPALKQRLADLLVPDACCCATPARYPLMVIEVSVPRSVEDMFPLVDEVLAIHAPYDVRRERACARGLQPEQFEARAAAQPTDDELCAMASFVIDNTQGDDTLFRALDAWVDSRGIRGLIHTDSPQQSVSFE